MAVRIAFKQSGQVEKFWSKSKEMTQSLPVMADRQKIQGITRILVDTFHCRRPPLD